MKPSKPNIENKNIFLWRDTAQSGGIFCLPSFIFHIINISIARFYHLFAVNGVACSIFLCIFVKFYELLNEKNTWKISWKIRRSFTFFYFKVSFMFHCESRTFERPKSILERHDCTKKFLRIYEFLSTILLKRHRIERFYRFNCWKRCAFLSFRLNLNHFFTSDFELFSKKIFCPMSWVCELSGEGTKSQPIFLKIAYTLSNGYNKSSWKCLVPEIWPVEGDAGFWQ